MCFDATSRNLFVEVAGWTISARYAAEVPEVGSQLERYARHLNAVEINSSFNKSHRVETYIRWSAATPIGFRFAVKAPRTITHEHRLVDCAALLDTFAAQVHGLGPKLGLILIQLPTSLVFELGVAEPFVASLRMRFLVPVAIEPRHPSWFTPEIEDWLRKHCIPRVAADPPIAPGGDEPGGWKEVRYYRWHGSPKTYFSKYDQASLITMRTRLSRNGQSGIPSWCIFDKPARAKHWATPLC